MTLSLTREQKEAVGLLQIGTFLEYFDLMLYVHMAVLLNELFFPKTDPHTASLLAAFAFCSTFVLRPFGALLFGYIGDHIGRKTTVIITTMMMSVSCIIMANLPTYEQIGITAAWVVTICRILQGLSSMGEIIGAEIYVTEITKPPMRYMLVSLIEVSSPLGGMAALAVASLVTVAAFNWRAAFLVGAVIAVVGMAARTRLRETPDFVDMKKRMQRAIEDAQKNNLGVVADLLKGTHATWKEKVNKQTLLAYFLIHCPWPLSFYFSFVYLGNMLKNNFGFTAEQVIYQNLIVAGVQFIALLFMALIGYKFYPLKVAKIRVGMFFILSLFFPYILNNISTSFEVLLLQCFNIFFALGDLPGTAIYISHFPVFRRFTSTSFIYAVSRAVMYAITSFGLVYIMEYFGNNGLYLVFIPLCLGYFYGVKHFEKLEKAAGNYPTTKIKLNLASQSLAGEKVRPAA